jgi:hypothetical protein
MRRRWGDKGSNLSLIWLAAFFAATIGPDHSDTTFITAQSAILPVIVELVRWLLSKIFLRRAVALGCIHFSGWRLFIRYSAYFAAAIGPDHSDTAFITAQNPVFPVIIVLGDFFRFV